MRRRSRNNVWDLAVVRHSQALGSPSTHSPGSDCCIPAHAVSTSSHRGRQGSGRAVG